MRLIIHIIESAHCSLSSAQVLLAVLTEFAQVPAPNIIPLANSSSYYHICLILSYHHIIIIRQAPAEGMDRK